MTVSELEKLAIDVAEIGKRLDALEAISGTRCKHEQIKLPLAVDSKYEEFVKNNDSWITIQIASWVSGLSENVIRERVIAKQLKPARFIKKLYFRASELNNICNVDLSSYKPPKNKGVMAINKIAKYLNLAPKTVKKYQDAKIVPVFPTQKELDRLMLLSMNGK